MKFIAEVFLISKILVAFTLGVIMLRRAWLNHFRQHQFKPLITSLGLALVIVSVSDMASFYMLVDTHAIITTPMAISIIAKSIAILIFAYTVLSVSGMVKVSDTESIENNLGGFVKKISEPINQNSKCEIKEEEEKTEINCTVNKKKGK